LAEGLDSGVHEDVRFSGVADVAGDPERAVGAQFGYELIGPFLGPGLEGDAGSGLDQ